ncbi:hypothetical protein [Bacillus sonorensis]|uniref:hypothetical protein n=1 Tax=Bacillus sonorensis TaxID=119858 RepID=UPI002DC055D7|nr:hypothetical protein [Bacillus sonorensis]MEC0342576.1 hypothetical protein [Bacillus sonorensis]MEC0457463.1 hypothetical protein [Bacillus sonorensis]MEC0530742.1 hypothetical protein [Bacillus sonorensis]
MPIHGEEKNKRLETVSDRPVDLVNSITGENVVTIVSSVDRTVSERYCKQCNEWKNAEGIIGGLFCEDCGTAWDHKF